MANEQTNDGNASEATDAWRQVRDAWLENWAKVMVEAVNTDAYAKATGTLLDSYLTASGPVREAMEKVMLSLLAQLSMPSRADVLGVAERMTNIEMRLDDMDAKLDRIERLVSKSPMGTPAGRAKKRRQ